MTCEVGYDATGSSNVLCQTDNFFSEPQLTCSPSTCGDLSLVSGFPAHVAARRKFWDGGVGSSAHEGENERTDRSG